MFFQSQMIRSLQISFQTNSRNMKLVTQGGYSHHMEGLGINGSYFPTVMPPLSPFYTIFEVQKACKALGKVNHSPWDKLVRSLSSH